MATKTLHLKLITPVKTVFEQDVDSVSIPTRLGQITVLPTHDELVSIIEPGELIVRHAGKESPLAIAGGIVEVFDNTLAILADSAEHASDIDLEQAETRAKELAEELKSEVKLDLTTYSVLERALQEEQARLLVAKKWRKLKM